MQSQILCMKCNFEKKNPLTSDQYCGVIQICVKIGIGMCSIHMCALDLVCLLT